MSVIAVPSGFTPLPVWVWRPNWTDAVVETFEFLTTVITDDAANEQRFGQRLTPRRSFSYSVLVNADLRNRFDMAINYAGGFNWYFPLWPEAFTAAGLTVGQSSFARDMSFAEFVPGNLCLIMDRDGIVAETRIINSVSNTALTVTVGLTNSYANAYIVPLFVGHLTTLPQLNRETDNMMSGTVTYESQTANPFINEVGTLDPLLSFGSFYLLATAPDYNQSNSYNMDRLLPVADGNTGLVTYFDFANYGFRSQTNTWFLKGRAAHANFKNFFYALLGRLHGVWLPTFNTDLVMFTDTPAGYGTFLARKSFIGDWGGITDDRRRIIIFFKDNHAPLCLTLTGYDDSNPAYDTFDVSPMFPFGVYVSGVSQICYMSLGRMDSDSISISHQTDVNGVGLATIPFRNLKVQPA